MALRAQNRPLSARSKPDCTEIGVAKTVDQTFLEKRLEIFSAVHTIVTKANFSKTDEPTNTDALEAVQKAWHDAHFFFDEKTEKYIEDIYDLARVWLENPDNRKGTDAKERLSNKYREIFVHFKEMIWKSPP